MASGAQDGAKIISRESFEMVQVKRRIFRRTRKNATKKQPCKEASTHSSGPEYAMFPPSDKLFPNPRMSGI